ncbi:MAG: hypothetical protein M1822_009273 [Bathelium mastoideum]|nr:MAG: hypothetical protein M1822_009273 [Bathelium mastoideum]
MDKIKNILNRGDKNGNSAANPAPQEGKTGALTGEGTHFGKVTQGQHPNITPGSSTMTDPPDSAVQMSSPTATGAGSGTGRGTLDNLSRPTMSDRTTSAASVKSGVVGLSPTATTTDHHPPPGQSPTSYRTVEGTPQHGNFDFESGRQPAQHSELGNAGSDLGVGAGASTIAAEKAFKSHQTQEPTAPTGSNTAGPGAAGTGLTGSTTGEREFPLSGGTTTGAPATDRTEPGVASTLGSGPTHSEEATGDGRAGLAGAASGALAHEHGGHGHAFEGDPCPPGESATEESPHFTSGPHVTDTANRLDPNLQPSSTSQTGRDLQSGVDPLAGSTAERGLGGQSTDIPQSSQTANPTSTQSQDTPKDHHYGRDAALAGAGATAAGAGAHALGSRDTQDTGPASRTIGPHKSDLANVADPRVQPEPDKMKNLGARNTNTGPASATIGPHDSNVRNVVDPKVQPEPEKMKDRETTGPHRSDLLNRLDPRVDSSRKNLDGNEATTGAGATTGAAAGGVTDGDPNISSPYNVQPIDPRVDAHAGPQAEQQQHHYGRDAAVAGGAAGVGAAGLGAYEARKDKNEPITTSQPSSTGYGEQPTTATQQTSTTQPSIAVPGSQSGAKTQRPNVPQPSRYESQAPVSGQEGQLGTSARSTSAGMPGAFPDSSEQEKPHYGRDAAVAGGVGAAGAGAYEAGKHLDDKSRVEPDNRTGYDSQRAEPPSSHPAQPITSSESQKPHYGRDAAVAGAAGATGIGAYEASKPSTSEPISSSQPSTTGYGSQPGATAQQPSNVPSSQPSGLGRNSPGSSTSQQTGAVTSGPARITEKSEPLGTGSQHTGYDGQQEPQHHYGRDAAIAGGAGAAGAGLYEADKHRHDPSRDTQAVGTQPSTGPSGAAAQQAAPSAGYAGQSGTQPATQPRDVTNQQQPQHHYGRDAALAGGAGAVGAGAYEAEKHHKEKDQALTSHPAQASTAGVTDPSASTRAPESTPSQTREEEPKQHHYGRDAAVAGGAGAAGAGAAYEYKQHEEEKRAKEAQAQAEKDAKQQQKELEQRQAQADKDLKAQQKANEKEAKKEQKEHDKAAAAAEKEAKKEQKEHDKAAAAAEKEHQKEAKKQEKEHEKAVAADEKERKKHEELAAGAVGGAAAAGGAAYAAEEAEDKHKDQQQPLDEEKHKKPGLLEKILHPRRSKEQQASAEEAESAEKERIIRDKAHDYETGSSHGTAVATDESGRHRLHKDPPASHPAAQQSGTVTEKHTGLPMNVGAYGSGRGGTDGAEEQIPGYEGSEVGAGHQDRIVTEPHTGLPMNVGKYGTGAGGTDGAEQIRNPADEGFEARATDWDAVKKANTPY